MGQGQSTQPAHNSQAANTPLAGLLGRADQPSTVTDFLASVLSWALGIMAGWRTGATD